MKTAHATLLTVVDDFYLCLTEGHLKSLTANLPSKCDVVLFVTKGVTDISKIHPLLKYVDRVISLDPIPYVQNNKRYDFDMTRLNMWKSIDFDQIFYLDVDCILYEKLNKLEDIDQFTCVVGKNAPLNSGRIIFKPNMLDYACLKGIYRYGSFNAATGWCNVGKFYNPTFRKEEMVDWDFPHARGAEGLFWYYFGMVTNKLVYDHRNISKAEHFTGNPQVKLNKILESKHLDNHKKYLDLDKLQSIVNSNS